MRCAPTAPDRKEQHAKVARLVGVRIGWPKGGEGAPTAALIVKGNMRKLLLAPLREERLAEGR